MTREEALKLFDGIEDQDDLQDSHEEKLFEYKKFFLSKAPISKLFESRIRKLVKLGEAYDLLHFRAALEGRKSTAFEDQALAPGSGGQFQSILESYTAFQKQKNEIKRQISNADSAKDLAELAESLVKLEKQNASQWNTMLENEEEIIVSKEPDPMYLLEAIKTYSKQNGETFAQLKNLENNPPELLIQEMKRLSLLFKKF